MVWGDGMTFYIGVIYPDDKGNKWMTKTMPVMEIFEMQGKQLLAKDVYS